MSIFSNKKISQRVIGWSRRRLVLVVFNAAFAGALIVGASLALVRPAAATTPDPGHPWSQVGDGTFSVTGPSSLHTFTFPDVSTTVLTTNAAVTVGQGGTGAAPAGDDQVLITNSSSSATWQTVPNCVAASSALTYTQSTNTWGCNTISAGTHALLDGNYDNDTVATTVTRGMLIVGNSTPKWSGLAVGGASTVLTSNGTDPTWGTVTNAMLAAGAINLASQVTGILPSLRGGTGSAYFAVAGPTGAHTYTFPDASTTVLTTNSLVTLAQGGTGAAPTGSDQLLVSGSTSAASWQQLIDCESQTNALTFTQATHSFGCNTIAEAAHALLDGATDSDTLATTVTRGMILIGNSTPKWASLAIGAANRVLTSNGTDPSWGQVANAMIASATLDLTAKFTGILPVANGGTGANTLALNNVLLGNGTSAVSLVSPATSGNILTANGTAWASAALTGTFIGIRTFTNGTTSYTPTAGTKTAVIELWGGGGAGGGVNGTPSDCGGGGGSGGYAMYLFTSMSAGPFTIAVGAGGTGAASAVGGNGGSTTFNTGSTTITAYGGTGGGYVAGSTTTHTVVGGAGGAIGANGTINAAGKPGGTCVVLIGPATGVVISGEGGSTALGGGAAAHATGNAVGTAAIAATGGGGSGAVIVSGTTTRAGGAGGTGFMRIWEFK